MKPKFKGLMTRGNKIDVWIAGSAIAGENGAPDGIINLWGAPTPIKAGSLCQFTGIYDSVGKEVYLSDIVQSPSGRYFEVFWHDNTMSIQIKDTTTGEIFNFNAPLYKVVGNIHSDILLNKVD